MYDFRDVSGRNKRRKQSKAGKFLTDTPADSKELEKSSEDDSFVISKGNLTKLKQDIRRKSKIERKKQLWLLILIVVILSYIFQHLGIFKFLVEEIF